MQAPLVGCGTGRPQPMCLTSRNDDMRERWEKSGRCSRSSTSTSTSTSNSRRSSGGGGGVSVCRCVAVDSTGDRAAGDAFDVPI